MNKILLRKLGNVYIFIIGFSIVPLLYFTANSGSSWLIHEILFWVALEVIADLKPFRVMFKVKMDMTISFAVQLSAVILLGTGQAVFTIILATLIVEILAKKPWSRILFNAGQYGLSLFITGTVFHLLKLSSGVPLDILVDLPAIVVSVAVYFLANTFFISAVISLTTGTRFFNIFLNDFLIVVSYFYCLAPISMAIALLYKHTQPYIILVMIPPVIMADQALRRYYSLHREAQETLKLLATTLDERDKYTSFHSVHVAEYSKKIAEQLDLNQEDIGEIELAGNVHDLGKVGIEDSILNKNGKLTNEEYDIVKNHPTTAYRLLNNLKPYKKCAEYVLHHHERYDGTGYPGKIAREDIPLGARILSVADSYDAMTTDRPYREALSQASAVSEMKLFSGTQFDPKVVEAFITVLKNDYGYVEEEE